MSNCLFVKLQALVSLVSATIFKAMNNLASLANQRNLGTRNKIAKPSKNKNKNNMGSKKARAPIKVVYISNPVKVETSASQFMALVQQFTGQDAELPNPTMYEQLDLDEANKKVVVAEVVGDDDDGRDCREPSVAEDSKPERSSSTATTTATTATTTTSSSEVDQVEEAPATCIDDDEFMMLENFSAADALASESFLWTWMS